MSPSRSVSPSSPDGRITAVVVDDEPLALDGIAALLRDDPELDVVATCDDGAAAIDVIARLQPDLVVLDVQMPEADGFDVIRAIGPERMPVTVFVTAFDQFAVRAFEVCAVDYVLKPFEDDRLLRAIERAKRAVRRSEIDVLGARLAALLAESQRAASRRPAPTRLLVRNTGRHLLVDTKDIDWIEGADYYVKLHVGRAVHMLRESLTQLEAKLDGRAFVRIHRSVIVNLARVRELLPQQRGDGVVVLEGGTRLRVSRSRWQPLQERIAASL